jgi:hypothetical protein
MIRADSKSDVLLSGPSKPLDFLICTMCFRALVSVEGMSIIEDVGCGLITINPGVSTNQLAMTGYRFFGLFVYRLEVGQAIVLADTRLGMSRFYVQGWRPLLLPKAAEVVAWWRRSVVSSALPGNIHSRESETLVSCAAASLSNHHSEPATRATEAAES